MNKELFRERLESLNQRDGGADKEAVRAIEEALPTWLEEGDLLRVLRINPHDVAARAKLEPGRVIPEFLHGVSVQLFDFHWDVHCPHCNMITSEWHDLNEAAGMSSCPMCEVDFDVDFMTRVEVTFSLTRDILDVAVPPMCEVPGELNPRKLVAGLTQGNTLSGETELEPGEYRYFCPITLSKGVLTIEGEPADDVTELALTQLENSFAQENFSAPPGKVRFVMTNEGAPISGLILHENEVGPELLPEQLGLRLSGLDVIHFPQFKELFGDQAPSERERMRIAAVTTMFTDISGSTSMYEALGDTVAYNIVRDHFEVLFNEVEKNEGAVIKTIGDSVMASFTSNESAVKALMGVRERMAAYNADKSDERRVVIKLGIHRGPAILVNLNGRIDYFGGAINKAARMEAISRGGEATLSDEVFADAKVRGLLKQNGVREVKRRNAGLKGLKGDHSVYSFAFA